jgi:hypothetical protein
VARHLAICDARALTERHSATPNVGVLAGRTAAAEHAVRLVARNSARIKLAERRAVRIEPDPAVVRKYGGRGYERRRPVADLAAGGAVAVERA